MSRAIKSVNENKTGNVYSSIHVKKIIINERCIIAEVKDLLLLAKRITRSVRINESFK